MNIGVYTLKDVSGKGLHHVVAYGVEELREFEHFQNLLSM